jgi:hypothetical protein
LSLVLGRLLATANTTNSTQICPKLPKSAKTCPNLSNDKTFKFHQKLRFQCFSKIKISIYRGGTRTWFCWFSMQEFFICYFSCGNWWFSQGSTPCVGVRFCGHVPNSPRNKNLKRLIPYLLEKVVFWTPKDCCPPLAGAKKTFSSILNVMILQMVRNESVRFGRHIDIEVSYKILWLEVPKLIPILHYLACF